MLTDSVCRQTLKLMLLTDTIRQIRVSGLGFLQIGNPKTTIGIGNHMSTMGIGNYMSTIGIGNQLSTIGIGSNMSTIEITN